MPPFRLRRAALAGVVAATVLLAVCFRLAPQARSGELVSSLSPLPGESRTAASDYERYLLREVYNDGKALQRPMVPAAAKTAISKPSFLKQAQAPRVARRGPGAKLRQSKLTTLHSTDAMSAQQAQRDLDGFWRQEDQKYGAADVRSPRAVRRAPHPVSVADRTPNPHANHHDHYRYVKPRSRDDPRTLGAKPWDYRWRRPSSAAAEPYEKYDTARKVKTQLLSARTPSAKMARARPKAEDLPPMPGSIDSLLKDLNN